MLSQKYAGPYAYCMLAEPIPPPATGPPLCRSPATGLALTSTPNDLVCLSEGIGENPGYVDSG